MMDAIEARVVDMNAEALGIPGSQLMENAGKLSAEFIMSLSKPSKIAIVCGTGNNGGDGYVIARHLSNSGFGVKVVICGDRNKIKGDAKINLDVLERMHHRIPQHPPHHLQLACTTQCQQLKYFYRFFSEPQYKLM